MAMPRPEPLDARALAVARWTVLWLGWLWLGQQGRLAGWGWAAGTAVVASWWALQVLAPAWPGRVSMRALGLLAALAVLGTEVLPADAARACVWLAAVPWGLWCGRLRAHKSCGQAGPAWAWAPAGAALLAGIAVLAWPGMASVLTAGLLTACALGLSRHRSSAAPREAASPAGRWSGMAMGLMMGSLWLSADWCSAAGIPLQGVIAAHLAVMGLLPALVSLRPGARRGLAIAGGEDLRLLLLAAGGLIAWIEPSPAGWAAAMACHALAWAAGVHRPLDRSGPPARYPEPVSSLAPTLGLAGPVLLLAVGLASQAWGPQALAAGHALVGFSAFAALVVRWTSLSLPERHTS